jgi:hypothetical protein
MRFWLSRNPEGNDAGCGEDCEEHGPGPVDEPGRPNDVVRAGAFAADGIEPGAIDEAVAVAARAAERNPERPRRGRLRPSRIRRLVQAPANAAAAISAAERRAGTRLSRSSSRAADQPKAS